MNEKKDEIDDESNKKQKRIVCFCFEGTHGSGKSWICNELKKMGMMVLDEFFLEQEPNCLDSQSFTNENIWVANWVSRLLLLAKEDPTDKLKIVFADRSPYTACVYAKKGRLLLRQVIDQYITELSEKNIFIFTIYLKVDRKVLWDRIQNRLKTEKIREFLRESQIEWMDEVRMRYEELKTLWNYVCEIDSFKISCIDLFEKLYESGVLQQEIIEKQQVLHNILHNKKCLQGIENNVDNINGFVDIAKIFKTILEKLIKK